MQSVKPHGKAAENAVRAFLQKYMQIGDDPTDTLIRDNVWTFLEQQCVKKHKLTATRLDELWNDEVDGAKKSDTKFCVIM